MSGFYRPDIIAPCALCQDHLPISELKTAVVPETWEEDGVVMLDAGFPQVCPGCLRTYHYAQEHRRRAKEKRPTP